jgi:hypothetical protein
MSKVLDFPNEHSAFVLPETDYRVKRCYVPGDVVMKYPIYYILCSVWVKVNAAATFRVKIFVARGYFFGIFLLSHVV